MCTRQKEYRGGLRVSCSYCRGFVNCCHQLLLNAPQQCAPSPLLAPSQLTFFDTEISFQGSVMGQGGSFDKRESEQQAARAVLERLGQVPPEAEAA